MQIPERFSPLFQNKVLLFQLSGLGILAIIIVIIGALLLTQGSTQLPGSTSTTPTPLVVRNFSTSPENASRTVSIYSPIVITFPGTISDAQKMRVTVQADPPILASREWSKNNTTLTLTPQTALSENQQYALLVTSPLGNYPFSFTATSAAETAKSSLKTAGLSEQQVATKFPWYKNLPLFTGKYFVTFNLKSEVFTAKLFLSNPAQTDVLKALVREKLDAMGVDLETYTINWQIES